MKESIDFDASGIKPVKASGIRWIAHKAGALKKVLYKYITLNIVFVQIKVIRKKKDQNLKDI